MVYNILTGGGFDKAVFGGWSLAMLVIPVLFFIVVFANRFLEDYSWNRLGAFVMAFVGYIIPITFTGAPKWGLAGGIIGMILGGFVIGMFLGGESDY